MRRWINRPEGSNWGEFGDDDRLGRLNLLTPQKVREGLAEAREGLTFCLSLPLDYPGGQVLAPHRLPPKLMPTRRHGQEFFNYSFRREGPHFFDCGCDDAVLLYTQYSTQWDSLAHVGAFFDADGDGILESVYYNGFRGTVDAEDASQREQQATTALGIAHMAQSCIQGRAVMVDLEGAFGQKRTLVGYDALMQVLETNAIAIEQGDILCLHTGFAQILLEMNRRPDPERIHTSCAVLDGADERLLQWITDSGIAAIAADNYAVEQIPARTTTEGERSFVPLHHHCLFKLGIPLGELWLLGDLNRWLRKHRRTRFLLTAPPLRLPGAVGSPVTPVATV
jgi:kynurenine formamidase